MTKTITISDETFELIKEQLKDNEKFDISEFQDFVGKKVFIRTVTYHLTGKITKIVGSFFILQDAAWIADSGRFMQAIQEGKLNEIEPVGDAMVNIQAITDMFPWNFDLPKEQK